MKMLSSESRSVFDANLCAISNTCAKTLGGSMAWWWSVCITLASKLSGIKNERKKTQLPHILVSHLRSTNK